MNDARDVQLLTDRAHDALRGAFRSGSLRDGQFVSISQLVDILGFPLAAVREAVKLASSQGLLTTLPKRGVRVMEARPETIRECLDFRMALDQEGGRRRLSRGVLSGLGSLRERHEKMRDAASSDATAALPPRAIAVDLSLHDYLAGEFGNSHLASAYDVNRMRIAIIQNARPFLQVRIVSAMEEHLAIIDAMERRDANDVVEAIRYHYEQTLRWWGAS